MSESKKRIFAIPKKEEVSPRNQGLFEKLEKAIGFMPNLYAYFGKNETALGDYLSFQNRKTTLSIREKEIVNLVTSEINGCQYCLAAHTSIASNNGFSAEQIRLIRGGTAPFDAKYDALTQLTAAIVNTRGRVGDDILERFFAAGYTEANLIDVIIAIGDKIISNYLHNLTEFPIDFPLAGPLNP